MSVNLTSESGRAGVNLAVDCLLRLLLLLLKQYWWSQLWN